MGRKPRISFPGALFHITDRGNNKEDIFIDKNDYLSYLELLKKYKKEFNFRLYAYVLMTNHLHLLMQIGEKASLSKIMQVINTAYAKHFTFKHKRIGHLFQGRYHDVLVDKDEYLFSVTQYIHLNPVRAGLVTYPQDYPWSSCKIYFNGESDSLVDLEEVFSVLGSDREEQRSIYKKLTLLEFKQNAKQEYLKEKLKKEEILGSEEFIEKILAKSGTKQPFRA